MDALRDGMIETALSILGRAKNSNEDWISHETRQLVECKQAARLSGKEKEYKTLMKSCKRQLRKDREAWTDNQAYV